MLRRAAPAVALFLAVRLAGVAVLAIWAAYEGRDPVALLGDSWDSRWYSSIAAHGYGRTVLGPNGRVFSDLAFFPLYPGLVAAVSAVLRITGGGAGLLVSWASAVAAACGIHAVGERLYGRRVAALLVLLWAVLPHSVVLSMAYTEPLLTAFAAWSLYALLTRRWLWAAALAVGAGLTRPNGYAVAAAVCAAALYEMVRGRGCGRVRAAAVIAPLGWAGYVLWAGARTGHLLGGYFTVQDGWGSRFDFGAGWGPLLGQIALGTRPPAVLVSVVLVGAALVLFVRLLRDRSRPPLPVLVYTAALLLVVLGAGGFFECRPRFLLPAFPLLLPVARSMAKARPGTVIVVISILAGLSLGYGAYLLTDADVPL
ncbi:hypothetical protein OG372_19500 [Streptomyces sp. NBC_01020]|nr:hypothetical protein OG372_19500 [Streptomyces sp. NBC_01020]WSX47032.1 hypothetical protein OG760_19215 [Streptomyces sp. NBC_00963]